MTIDKAIERLETFIERHPSAGYSDLIPAVQLGIEALERYVDLRKYNIIPHWEKLPGETKD